MSGEREGRGSEGRREGAGGDSDAVPHNVVIEENVRSLPYLPIHFNTKEDSHKIFNSQKIQLTLPTLLHFED